MLITAFLAALVALVLTAIGIPRFIMFFHKKKLGGQPTLEEVKQHASKPIIGVKYAVSKAPVATQILPTVVLPLIVFIKLPILEHTFIIDCPKLMILLFLFRLL